MSRFKYVFLLVTSFFLGTAVQAVPMEGHFLKTVDSPAAYDTTGQFLKVASNNWYVIAGSYPQNRQGKMEARNRLASIQRAGFDGFLVADSDDYGNLTDGLWVVMAGPYRKSDANWLKNQLKISGKVRGAYIKRGW